MRKKTTTPPVTTSWLIRQVGNPLRRSLIGAAIICLAIGGSLYAINRSRPPVTASNAVEASAHCDTGMPSSHAAHSSESNSEADSDTSQGEPPLINAASAPAPAPEGMVWIPGGEFSMGAEDPEMRDARPFHRVALDGFWMDQTEVTNEEFTRFVKATGYVTVAERPLDPRISPAHHLRI